MIDVDIFAYSHLGFPPTSSRALRVLGSRGKEYTYQWLCCKLKPMKRNEKGMPCAFFWFDRDMPGVTRGLNLT